MRHERAYSRRHRGAVTFAGSTRTVTISLEISDFERLEQLATKHNVGNATLGRQIIRKYLEWQATEAVTFVSSRLQLWRLQQRRQLGDRGRIAIPAFPCAGVDPARFVPRQQSRSGASSGLPLEIEGRKPEKARACSLWFRTRKHAPLSSIVQGGREMTGRHELRKTLERTMNMVYNEFHKCNRQTWRRSAGAKCRQRRP